MQEKKRKQKAGSRSLDRNAEAPAVYALKRNGSEWTLSRRSFLAATATAGASVLPASSKGHAQNPLPTGPSSGRQKAVLYAHYEAVSLLAFTPDGKHLVSGSMDKTVKLWSVEDRKLQHTLTGHGTEMIKHGGSVHAIATAGEKQILISAAGGFNDEIALYSIPGGDRIKNLTGTMSEITAVAAAPDGSNIAVATKTGPIKLWSASEAKILQTIEGSTPMVAVAMTPEGKTIAAASADGVVKLWSEGREIKSLSQPIPKLSVLALSPDGKTLVCGSAGEKESVIRTCSVLDNRPSRDLQAHKKPVRSLAVSPDGKTLASGDEDGTLFLWSLETGQVIGMCGDPSVLKAYLLAHRGAVNSLAISADGQLIVSASSDRSVKLWFVAEAKLQKKLELKGEVQAAVLTPDGKLLATAVEKTIQLWSLPDVKEIRSLTGHENTVTTLALAADGRLLVSGALDRTVRLWSLPGGESVKVLKEAEREINRVTLSADGKLLAGASGERIQLWSLPDGRPLQVLRGHIHLVRALAVLPDGNLAVSGASDETARVWLLPDGKLVSTFTDHGSVVSAVALTPDGQWLISGGGDKMVRRRPLSRTGDSQLIGGHAATVLSLALSTDGKLLVSGDAEGVILVWDLSAAEPDVKPCRLRGYLFDAAANQSDAISYKVYDRITGGTITYTLPCGSPIPPGATCVCNCVPGSWSAPSSGGGFWSHYWYPN